MKTDLQLLHKPLGYITLLILMLGTTIACAQPTAEEAYSNSLYRDVTDLNRVMQAHTKEKWRFEREQRIAAPEWEQLEWTSNKGKYHWATRGQVKVEGKYHPKKATITLRCHLKDYDDCIGIAGKRAKSKFTFTLNNVSETDFNLLMESFTKHNAPLPERIYTEAEKKKMAYEAKIKNLPSERFDYYTVSKDSLRLVWIVPQSGKYNDEPFPMDYLVADYYDDDLYIIGKYKDRESYCVMDKLYPGEAEKAARGLTAVSDYPQAEAILNARTTKEVVALLAKMIPDVTDLELRNSDLYFRKDSIQFWVPIKGIRINGLSGNIAMYTWKKDGIVQLVDGHKKGRYIGQIHVPLETGHGRESYIAAWLVKKLAMLPNKESVASGKPTSMENTQGGPAYTIAPTYGYTNAKIKDIDDMSDQLLVQMKLMDAKYREFTQYLQDYNPRGDGDKGRERLLREMEQISGKMMSILYATEVYARKKVNALSAINSTDESRLAALRQLVTDASDAYSRFQKLETLKRSDAQLQKMDHMAFINTYKNYGANRGTMILDFMKKVEQYHGALK